MDKIYTERLSLVSIQEKDVPDIHNLNSYEDVARYNTIGIPKSQKDTYKLFEDLLTDKEQKMKLGWTIRLKDQDKFIGELGMRFSAERNRRAEIHYSLLPKFWGNGYAYEAVSCIIDWGFNSLKLHRIEAGVATPNERSINLLEKVGMQREGLCRQILPINGEWVDNYMYAILDSDPR